MAHTHGEAGAESERRQGAGGGMQSCIEDCTVCHRACLQAVQTCLRMGGRHAAAEHIALLLDCAQICATSADFMERGSAQHAITCGACAEICRGCAQSCRQLGGAEMESCARACDTCAASCETMAAGRSSAAHH